MKLEHICCFLALSRRLNFTKASAELYIAQPSLSRNIALLEEEVGGQLFHRSKQSVSLTSLGKSFLPYAQQIKKAHDETDAFIETTKKNPRKMQREIRIGFGVFQLMDFLPEFFAHVTEVVPNLKLTVTDGLQDAIFTKLREGELDFIFTAGHSLRDVPGVDTLLVCSVPLQLAISPRHKLASGAGPVSIKTIDACGLPLFTLQPNLAPRLKQTFPSLEIKLIRSITRCMAMIEAGMGIAILSDGVGRLYPKEVKFIAIEDYPTRLDLFAAWKKKEPPPRWWDEFIREASRFIREKYPDSDAEKGGTV